MTFEPEHLMAILDSLTDPILLADTDHVVRFMNRAALEHYGEGEALLGTCLFECHNEHSCRIMKETLAALERGEDERLISSDEKRRVYMRAVRGRDGSLIGYYERYAPPEVALEG